MKKVIFSIVLITSIMFNLSIAGNQKSENDIKVTTLIENSCITDRNDLTSEHGVSMHIQFGDTNILFDTGSSDNFIKNAIKLKISVPMKAFQFSLNNCQLTIKSSLVSEND